MPDRIDPESGLRVVAMAEFGRRIAARKAELGIADLSRHAGTKRAPLKAIEDAGGKWWPRPLVL